MDVAGCLLRAAGPKLLYIAYDAIALRFLDPSMNMFMLVRMPVSHIGLWGVAVRSRLRLDCHVLVRLRDRGHRDPRHLVRLRGGAEQMLSGGS